MRFPVAVDLYLASPTSSLVVHTAVESEDWSTLLKHFSRIFVYIGLHNMQVFRQEEFCASSELCHGMGGGIALYYDLKPLNKLGRSCIGYLFAFACGVWSLCHMSILKACDVQSDQSCIHEV